jgi:hypothetical protein
MSRFSRRSFRPRYDVDLPWDFVMAELVRDREIWDLEVRKKAPNQQGKAPTWTTARPHTPAAIPPPRGTPTWGPDKGTSRGKPSGPSMD